MVSLSFLFVFFVVLFGIIGAMRGWAKEIMVSFSVILALSFLTALETYVPFYRGALQAAGGKAQFWARSIVVILLVFFGYQTPNLPRIGGNRFARERLQDTLLGLFLGAFNGYLVAGTLWSFMHAANYPFVPLISPPVEGTPMGEAALKIIPYLPPSWLGVPYIYFAVIIAFVFVIIVFL